MMMPNCNINPEARLELKVHQAQAGRIAFFSTLVKVMAAARKAAL
jgi:hypothetical protein